VKIFISYRRADSQSNTDRIHEHLASAFGAENVFQDVLDIEYGHDFRDELREQVTACDVLLVIIGPTWATMVDQDEETGKPQPRLFNPDDFVRFEVETGLSGKNVLVIPVLVNGAALPEEAQLPASLHPLRYRNAIDVRNNPYFDDDIARLIRQLHDYAREQGIAVRRRRALSQPWLLVAVVAVVVTLALVGALLAIDPFAAGKGNRTEAPPTEAAPPEFVSEDMLFIDHRVEDFEAVVSETLSDAALKDFLSVDQVFWGELPELKTAGYDVRLTITNTGTREIKLALDPRYFALEDSQGQRANLLYFCCATEGTILAPGQQRQVRLIFEERENWAGARGKYEGGGVETSFFLRVNGFLPIVRDTWQLYAPIMLD
jgi:hypothetical protein